MSSSAFEATSDEPFRYQAWIHRRSRTGPVDPLRCHYPSRWYQWPGLRVARFLLIFVRIGLCIRLRIGLGLGQLRTPVAIFYFDDS